MIIKIIVKKFSYLIITVAFLSIGSAMGAGAVRLGDTPSFTYESIHAGIDWYRESAEKKAIYNEIFKMAYFVIDQNVEKVKKDYPGEKWGVVFDLDDTVFDNHELNWKFYRDQKVYEADIQKSFIIDGEKTVHASPGVIDLITYVRNKGGEVSFVTDRRVMYAPYTDVDLGKIGLVKDKDYRQILYYDFPLNEPVSGAQPKQERFDAVDIESGKPSTKVTAYHVVAYFGDNILDFPHSNQGDYDQNKFGSIYFCLPNPMYGSWTSVDEPLPEWKP